MSRISFASTVTVVAVFTVASQTACTNLDQENRLEDARILAVRTEPAEILYSPLFLIPPAQRPPGLLPTTNVKVEVFAYDPRGGLMTTSMQLCPEGFDASCLDFIPEEYVSSFPTLSDDGKQELRNVFVPSSIESSTDTVDPAGKVPSLSRTFAFTPNVVDTIIPKDAQGNALPSFFSSFPRFAVETANTNFVEVGQPARVGAAQTADVVGERAFKRIPVGIDLTSEALPLQIRDQLAASLGVQFCTEDILYAPDFAEGPAPCLATRAPNQNPPLVGFNVRLIDDAGLLAQPSKGMFIADTSDVSPNALLKVPSGALLEIVPVFRDGAVEPYQIVSFDFEKSQLTIENRVEDFALAWYTTAGSTSNFTSSLQFQESLNNLWQLPQRDPGERESLVLVVVDQRGGTAVGQINLEF